MDNLKVIHTIDQALNWFKKVLFTYNLIIFNDFIQLPERSGFQES